MTRLPLLLALTACAPVTLVEPERPYDGKWTPHQERPADEFNTCPPQSSWPGKLVKPGHEDALCYEDAPERPEPKQPPSVECSDAGKWIPGRTYALGGGGLETKCG